MQENENNELLLGNISTAPIFGYDERLGQPEDADPYNLDYKVINNPGSAEDVVRSLAAIDNEVTFDDDMDLRESVLSELFSFSEPEVDPMNMMQIGGQNIPVETFVAESTGFGPGTSIEMQKAEDQKIRRQQYIREQLGDERYNLYLDYQEGVRINRSGLQSLEKEWNENNEDKDKNPYSGMLSQIDMYEKQLKPSISQKKREAYMQKHDDLIDESFYQSFDMNEELKQTYSKDFIEDYESLTQKAGDYLQETEPELYQGVDEFGVPTYKYKSGISEGEKVETKQSITDKTIKLQNKYLESVQKTLEQDKNNHEKYLQDLGINTEEDLVKYLRNPEVEEEEKNKIIERSSTLRKNIDNFRKQAVFYKDQLAALSALDKSYSLMYRTSLAMEDAFLGDMGLFLKAGTAALGEFVLPETKTSEYLKEAYRSHIDYAESVKQKRQAHLAAPIKYADMEFGKNFIDFTLQQLADNSPSIATSLTYAGVARKLAAKGLTGYGKTAIGGTFFTMEGGGRLSEMEIMQKNAAKNIEYLESIDLSQVTPSRALEVQREIERNERALNYTQAQRAFSALTYGGVATAAELLGTMRFIDEFSDLAKFKNLSGDLSLTSILRGGGQFVVKGPAIELLEESVTLLGHNFIDNAIGGENKSLIEGLDADFVSSVLISSLAIGSGTVAPNIRNAFRNHTQTKEQTREFADLAQEYIENQWILDNGTNLSTRKGINKKQADFIKARQMEILETIGQKDIMNQMEAANLNEAQIKELFELNARQAAIIRKGSQLGGTGLQDDAIKRDRDKLNKEYNDLQDKKEQLLKTPAKERNEKLKKTAKDNDVQESDAMKYSIEYSRAAYFDNLISGLSKGKNKVIKIDGENAYDDLTKYLDDAIKSGKIKTIKMPDGSTVTPSMQKFAILSGFISGSNATFVGNDILTFEDNRRRSIIKGNDIERADAVQAAVHELQHLHDMKQGLLLKDGRIVSSHKPLVTALQQEVENQYKEGKISKKIYNQFRKRVDQYKRNNNNRVDQSELITLLGTMKRAGILDKEQSSILYSIKSFINKLRSKLYGDNHTLLNIKSTKDVLRYIDSFNRAIQNKRNIIQLPPEEEQAVMKESLGVDVFDQINNLIPEDVKTKQDFLNFFTDQNRNSEIGKALSKGGLIYNVVKQKTNNDEFQTTMDGVIDRVINFNPEAVREDGATVGREGFTERIFSDTRFARMDARKALATRQPTVSLDDPDVRDVADDTPTPTKRTQDKTKKTVVASKLGVKSKVDEAIKKQLPDLDVENLTFKKLKNLVPDITGELFGISPKKLKTLANITKPELQKAQMFINKNADLLIAMLPKGTTVSGTATGVPNSLLKAFYTKTDRAKLSKTGSASGLPVQVKNKINRKEFLETFGIIDGKPTRDDRNTSARVLALANLTGKMMTNQAVRQNLELLGKSESLIQNIKEGTSGVMFSLGVSDLGLIDFRKMINDPKNGINNFDLFVDKMILLADYMPPGLIRVVDLRNFGITNPAVKDYARSTTLYEELGVFTIGKSQDREYLRPDAALGKNVKNITKDKVKKYNESGAANFNAMVEGVKKAIEANPNDKELHSAIYAYLSSAVNDTTHPLRTGAEYIGGDITAVGDIIYEHALQNASVRDLLMDTLLNRPKDFNKTLKAIKKNYKLIALSAADAKAVDTATYIDENGNLIKYKNGMGVGWDIFVDNWFDRYFNTDVNAVDPNKIKVIKNGKTFAEEYGITMSGKSPVIKSELIKSKILDKAINKSRQTQKQSLGISILDFDDTLATTESLVKYTAPNGDTGTLNAEQFASTYQDLQDQGYKFDFSDFNRVVKGKLAPLFNKALKLQSKFGPENMFVLTARPPAAQKPIFDFLKANGLNIPLKNITGLGNSTSEAKALWIADKVAEGYNDFYFADDALQNVQAVKNMLDQFDVKSKVQQAKVKFSLGMDGDFNKILEEVTGIDAAKRFSDMKAKKRGASKGKFRFFIPPSHEDFVGLLYNFMGKGRQGDAHRDFFEKALIKPLNRAYKELNTAKQAIANDYKALNKQFSDVKSKLTKKTPDGDFTFEDAIRVYLWNKHGHDIPGLSKTDQNNLVDLVNKDSRLRAYAETIDLISKQENYIQPSESWDAGSIKLDLVEAIDSVSRQKFFEEFFNNTDIIFSQENLNKIQAAFGASMVSAIKDILYRIKTGKNRPSGQNKMVNQWLNYLNGSVAATMFFNIRSAVLQQMSLVNFINFADNNIFNAAKAFANQEQYWKDWSFLFNSDFMKQRRGGIMTDVNGAELAASVQGAKNPVQAIIKKLLQLGFLPTQIGDNIAIATGGAAFYRNRVNTYLKKGLSQKEAETRAFDDFQELAEATQQSARPDMVSQQQASPLGKVILAFQNVTSQFNRLGKKAFLDLYNRRITPGNATQFQSDVSNVSRIAYYFAIQNLIFYALQSALFAFMFDGDEEDESYLKKKDRMISGSIDSVLRGAGVMGAAVATLKNMARKWHEQRNKKYNKDESAVLMELLNVSPPLGIKARKIVNAEKTMNYNESIMSEMQTFDADNPGWSAATNYIEALTNLPVNRLYNKLNNVRSALDNQNNTMQRVLMFSGWSKWNLGIEDTKIKEIREVVKEKKKEERKLKRKLKKQKFAEPVQHNSRSSKEPRVIRQGR